MKKFQYAKAGDAVEFISDESFNKSWYAETGKGMSSHFKMGDGPWWQKGTYVANAKDWGRSFHHVTDVDGKSHYVPARRLRAAKTDK